MSGAVFRPEFTKLVEPLKTAGRNKARLVLPDTKEGLEYMDKLIEKRVEIEIFNLVTNSVASEQ